MWKLAEDTIGHADIDALTEWLRTYPHLTQGPQVQAFEAEWSKWLNVKHSVMVSSGTTANFALAACAARRVQRRPVRIGVAAVTWSTNVTPSLFLGHEVVVFDVDKRTLGMNLELVCEAIRTRAIDILFVTHLLGFNALTDEVLALAAAHEVVVIEDCCESHGAHLQGRRVGSLGIGGTFSFYFGHHMSTIEGGMVSTNDAELADDLRLFRSHGLARASCDPDKHARHHPEIDPRFLFVQPGLNFRSTDLNAFLGRRQLAMLDARIDVRNGNLHAFLGGLPPTMWRDFATSGCSSFALPLIADDLGTAKQVRERTHRLGIETRPIVAGNLLRQPFLKEARVAVFGGSTPVADHIHRCGLYVGNGHHVPSTSIAQLTDALQ